MDLFGQRVRMGKWVCDVSKKVLGGKGGKINGLNYWGFQLNGLYCLERCGLKWDVITVGEYKRNCLCVDCGSWPVYSPISTCRIPFTTAEYQLHS